MHRSLKWNLNDDFYLVKITIAFYGCWKQSSNEIMLLKIYLDLLCHVHDDMETVFVSLALCWGNPPVTGRSPLNGPINAGHWWFPVFLNKLLNKQSICRLFVTPWLQCDVTAIFGIKPSLITSTMRSFAYEIQFAAQSNPRTEDNINRSNFPFTAKNYDCRLPWCVIHRHKLLSLQSVERYCRHRVTAHSH